MENNQQPPAERNPASADRSFENRQPGQRPPTDDPMTYSDLAPAPDGPSEVHSESSRPDRPNETLGTP